MAQVYRLVHNAARENACHAIRQAPDGYVVKIEPEKRTVAQNSRLWAMLTDISEQVEWYGEYLTPENWKDILTAALKKEKIVPGIAGGFVILGQRTSKMNKREMSDLFDVMEVFAAEKGVKFHAPDLSYSEVPF